MGQDTTFRGCPGCPGCPGLFTSKTTWTSRTGRTNLSTGKIMTDSGPRVKTNARVELAKVQGGMQQVGVSPKSYRGITLLFPFLKASLHVTSMSPCPSPSPLKFSIVPMLTDRFDAQIGLGTHSSVSVNLMVTVTEIDSGMETVRVNEPLQLNG